MRRRLVLFVKAPVPGNVKTRLVPPLSAEKAASLYRRWAREAWRTARTLRGVEAEVAYEPHPEFPDPGWLSEGGRAPYFFQEGRDLGEKLERAFLRAFDSGANPVAILGSDSPGLPAGHLRSAFSALDGSDLVLGPVPDGGYYLIGLSRRPPAGLLRGIAWSTPHVQTQTLANARRLGWSARLAPSYIDVDTADDLRSVFPGLGASPAVSVIIPVLDEEKVLAQSLSRLLSGGGRVPIETVVVDGGSRDASARIAAERADRVVAAPRPGRGLQMHIGACQAAAPLLLFLHADTELPACWQDVAADLFLENADPPAAAAFRLGFDSAAFSYRALAALAACREKFTRVPHGDQALFVRRDAYFRCGGFPDVPLMEEYFLLPRMRRLGRIVSLPAAVRTSSRKYERTGPLRNSLLNSLLILLFYMGVSPAKIASWYKRV